MPPLGTYCLLCTGQHGPWAIPAESLKNPTPNWRLQGLLARGLGSGIFWSNSRESEHRVEFSLLSLQEAAQRNADVQNPPLTFTQGSKCLLAPSWTLVDWGTPGTDDIPLSFAFLNTDLLGSPGCGLSWDARVFTICSVLLCFLLCSQERLASLLLLFYF